MLFRGGYRVFQKGSGPIRGGGGVLLASGPIRKAGGGGGGGGGCCPLQARYKKRGRVGGRLLSRRGEGTLYERGDCNLQPPNPPPPPPPPPHPPLPGKDIPDRSTLQVIPVRKVSELKK